MFVPACKLLCCMCACGHQFEEPGNIETSASQKSSHFEGKGESLAVPADVIGGNSSVCDGDRWHHKVGLSPCV